jgi:hypothetical protein
VTDGPNFDDLIAAVNGRDGAAFRAAISSLGTEEVARLLLLIVGHQWELIDEIGTADGDSEYVYRIVELLLSGPDRSDATIIQEWRYVNEAAADRKLNQLRDEGRTVAKQIGQLRWLSEDEVAAIARAIDERNADRGQRP